MLQLEYPNKQYVLPLDSLDLKFLNQYVERPDETKIPLWSKPVLYGESKYYQVEIISDDTDDEESFFEPCETYMCHICNINVPQPYYKQHTKSKQHQIYKTLTEKVLENLAKQINVDIDNVDNYEHNDVYYCEICCKVVLAKHKRSHNKSKYHLKSIENRKLANSFIEMYSEIKNSNNFKSENNNTFEIDKNETVSEYDSASETEITTEYDSKSDMNNFEITPSNSVLHKKNTVLPETSELDGDGSPLSSPEISDFMKYFLNISKKYELLICKPPKEENGLVNIVTPKGHKEKVTIDTFHGFKRVDSVTVYCQLCSMWIVTSHTSSNEHIETENHAKSVIQRINNDFTRLVINPILNMKWNHCLLCNELVIIGSNHADVHPNHKKYQASKNNVTVKKVIPAKANETYCDVCNVYIDTHNFLSHTEGKKHKDLSKQKATVKKSTKVKANKTTVKKPTKVLADNNIEVKQKIAQTNDLYCDTCKVNVPIGGMDVHILGKAHLKNLNSKTKVKNEKVANNTPNINNLPSTSKPIATHTQRATVGVPNIDVNDQVDKKKLRQYIYEDPLNNSPLANAYRQIHDDLLLRNKIIRMKDSTFYCCVCFIILTRISEIDHMLGERHRFSLNS